MKHLESNKASRETLPQKRIMVVDDNADAARTLGLLLKTYNQEVDIVLGGEEALIRAEAFKPDIILLDLGLPGMDGYEVAMRVRRLPGLEHVLIAAVTGYGAEEDKRRSELAGFNFHLVKPVDFGCLGEIIEASESA